MLKKLALLEEQMEILSKMAYASCTLDMHLREATGLPYGVLKWAQASLRASSEGSYLLRQLREEITAMRVAPAEEVIDEGQGIPASAAGKDQSLGGADNKTAGSGIEPGA